MHLSKSCNFFYSKLDQQVVQESFLMPMEYQPKIPNLQEKLLINSNNKVIDNKLVIGSALFGAGWGLGGLCPGPAISSLALLNIYSVTFVISMFVGFYLVKTLKSI